MHCSRRHRIPLCSTDLDSTLMYWTVLYYTELYCTLLYWTVLYWTKLNCTVPYCTELYCFVLYWTAFNSTLRSVPFITSMYCNMMYFNLLDYLKKHRNVMFCTAPNVSVLYFNARFLAQIYCIVLCSTALHCTALAGWLAGCHLQYYANEFRWQPSAEMGRVLQRRKWILEAAWKWNMEVLAHSEIWRY